MSREIIIDRYAVIWYIRYTTEHGDDLLVSVEYNTESAGDVSIEINGNQWMWASMDKDTHIEQMAFPTASCVWESYQINATVTVNGKEFSYEWDLCEGTSKICCDELDIMESTDDYPDNLASLKEVEEFLMDVFGSFRFPEQVGYCSDGINYCGRGV